MVADNGIFYMGFLYRIYCWNLRCRRLVGRNIVVKDTVIKEIMQSMLPFLDNAQLLQLQAVLSDSLAG